MTDKEQRTSLAHTFYSLEKPDWLISSGMSKGIYHDRYALGAVLSAGVKIRFRQSFPASGMGSILHLLNNDSKTEIQQEVTTAWSEVISNVPSVPFFTTPYTEHARERISIDVEIEGDWKVLPIYKSGVNADLFFSVWDSVGAEYALFDSTCAKILIPVKDKVVMKTLHQVSGLQGLTDYYNGVFEYFNYLVGLSFDTAVPTDRNIPNRYFMKADKSGAGSAYYGEGWTAETSDSVAAFWLDIQGTNWGSLHEIGHGYQGLFMSNSTIKLGEVWNNLFAANYQYKLLGSEVYEAGWLYSGGEQNLYSRAMAAFDNGSVDADLALTLYFLLLMFARMGDRGIVEFHQRYRRLSNSPGFKAEDYPTMDFLSRVAIDVANVDVSAFMNFTKASLVSQQVVENAFSNATPLYPLYLLVPQSELGQVQARLGLRSPLDLVSCAQLDVTGLTGSVSFNFDGSIYSKISGKSFLLRDGRGPAKIVKISSMSVAVSNLPVGIYVLQLPSIDDGEYQAVSRSVVVKEKQSNYACVYERRNASNLADQHIFLGGLGGIFCKLGVNVSTGGMLVEVLSTSPHSYFKDEVYAEIRVMNSAGSVVFLRSMLGDKTELFSQNLPVASGYVVEIMHAEPSRLSVSNSSASTVIDSAAKVNRLRLTDQGLVNTRFVTDAGENLKNEIDKCAMTFESSPHLILHDEYPVKQDLRRAINTFAEPVCSQLFERYQTLEFARPTTGSPIMGTRFIWPLQGNAGRAVGSISMNTGGRIININFSAVVPHEYFSSVYVSVMLKSKEGEILYLRELRGDMLAEASHVELPFALGSTVSVMHREPFRSKIINEATQKITPVGCVQHVVFTALLGMNMYSYWPVITD